MSERTRDFDRDGFIVVRAFLTGDEFSELQTELDRFIADVVPSLSSEKAFYHERSKPETLKQLQYMGVDPYFAAYRKNPKWCELATELMGEACAAKEPEWFNKPPATDHPTPPHQDNYYFCLKPSLAMTLWLAIDPVDEENGCLRYVAGSHKRGIRPHRQTSVLGFSQGISDYGEQDSDHEVQVTLEPGDLAVHHCETIHRADPNRSLSRQRRAFAQVFVGARATRDAEAFQQYQSSVKSQHEDMGL